VASVKSAACGCLPWHDTRMSLSSRATASVCTDERVLCLRQVDAAAAVAPINVTRALALLRLADFDVDEGRLREECSCLPPCRGEKRYGVHTATVFESGCSANEAKVSVKFDREASVELKRRLLLPWELTLGGVGGLLSLLTGFSVVFILEICYFCTVRWRDAAIDMRSLDGQVEQVKDEEEDGILWRTASDTNLTALGGSIRWDSPVVNQVNENRVASR